MRPCACARWPADCSWVTVRMTHTARAATPSQSLATDLDGPLLLRWRSGDAAAGDELIRRHHPRLDNYFRRRFRGDISDLTQRTWLTLFETQDRIQHEDRFGHYCLGIARNVALEEIRRRVRREPTAADLAGAATAESLEELATRHETMQELVDAIAELQRDFASVIQLFYYERRPAPAVGQALGIPENTARSRLRRAREFLRARVER